MSFWIVLLIVVIVLVIIVIGFFFLVAWGIDAGFANRYPIDKYDLLTTIAENDTELQQQKDIFIKKAIESEYFVGTQNEEIINVKYFIHNLIYPNHKYALFTCPSCSSKLFWILGDLQNNHSTGDWKNDRWDTEIRYFALCASCIKIVHHYDESIYDREVFKRMQSIVPDENIRHSYIRKIEPTLQKRRELRDEFDF